MKKVIDLIFEACNRDKVILKNPEINLFETGLLDSMGFIELLTEIEEEFEIEIEPADVSKEKLGTPNDICHYVEQKLRG